MDNDLTEEQRIFRETVRSFAERELSAGAEARAANGTYPWDVAKKAADAGLLGIMIPEADGGLGGTVLDAIIAIQSVAEFCPRSADVIQAGNFGAIRTFSEYATDAQKERYLPGLLAGEAVMSVGMTEPGAGSAVTELTTSAVKNGSGYIIRGQKIFGTNSVEANVFLVYVRFDKGVGGIGAVLVERGTPGFEVGQPSSFMNGEIWSPLYFDECHIPAENVLLGAGGFKKQISGFNVERLGNAARAVQLGRYAFNYAKEYAATRKQFGRPLCEFQGIQWKFAEMEVRLRGAQCLLIDAARKAGNGLPSADDTAVAKLACNEAGFFAANEAMQITGGLGFSEESIVQYCFGRTRGWMIAGGSLEILKNRIAEGIFERRFSQRPGQTHDKMS